MKALKYFAVIVGLLALVCGCGAPPSDNLAAPELIDYKACLGKDQQMVLSKLHLSLESDFNVLLSDGKQLEVEAKEPLDYDGAAVRTKLIFYNGILMDVVHTFDRVETGFAYAKQLQAACAKAYRPSDSSGVWAHASIGTVGSVDDFVNSHADCRDEWLFSNNPNLYRSLFGERPGAPNTDLRLQVFQIQWEGTLSCRVQLTLTTDGPRESLAN